MLLKTSKINAGFSLGGAFLAQSAFSCPLIEASINLSVRALPAVPPTNQQRSSSSLRSSDLTAVTDPNNNWADGDPTVVLPRRKKRPSAYRAGGLEAKITSTFIRTALSQSPTLRPKPASSSLDRVSPVPTADSWAGRWGPAVCAALAGSAGFQVSDPNQASADRYVVGYDFLDLTFYFSFAGVAGELLQSYSA